MPRVRFYIDAEATEAGANALTQIEEVFALGIELDNLTNLVASGKLSIDSIQFENLDEE